MSSPPPLSGGELHVWRLDLDRATAAADVVSGAERARADRIVGAQHAERWVRARGHLRVLLGAYAGADPAALVLHAGVDGKPALAGEVRFNLAHSGAVALVAIAHGVDVGVDVEVRRRAIDELAVAGRVLAAATVAELAALSPGPERTRAFLRAWTRHEAAVKCRGTTIAEADPATVANGLWLAELPLEDGVAAVAATAAPAAVALLAWGP